MSQAGQAGSSGGSGPPFISNDQNVYVSAQTGSDSVGTGSAINPYATIGFALTTISDNGELKPYTIHCSGALNEGATITLKPFVSIVGAGVRAVPFNSSSETTTTFQIDSSFDVSDNLISISNLGDSNTNGNIAFDFDTTGFTHIVEIDLIGNLCGSLIGNSTTGSKPFLYLQSNNFQSNNFTNCDVQSFGNSINGGPQIALTNAALFLFLQFSGDVYNGGVALSNSTTADIDATFTQCSVPGNMIGTVTSSGAINVSVDAVSYPQSGSTTGCTITLLTKSAAIG